MLALEDRLRASVLVVAGFAMTTTQPSVEPLDFAPRVGTSSLRST